MAFFNTSGGISVGRVTGRRLMSFEGLVSVFDALRRPMKSFEVSLPMSSVVFCVVSTLIGIAAESSWMRP